ncbi:MAG TPA: AAA family ATPase [Opitutaceae bacterium]|nr:AAA family ATPase [Opitutaceae bacterium]
MPYLLIIAGPNGAGKTTFANEYLSAQQRAATFVNADEIARELPALSDVAAARLMLDRINSLVADGADFTLETTLASRTYAQKIPQWQTRGYVVCLIFIGLRSVEESLARVKKRVAAGGHGIPELVVRRRFLKSRNYFQQVYKPIVDVWYEWESREGEFAYLDSGARS